VSGQSAQTLEFARKRLFIEMVAHVDDKNGREPWLLGSLTFS
jgi:hypothetical protein